MKLAVIGLLVAALAASCGNPVSGQAPPAAPLAPDALREWLTVLSSDEFEGRATFSPGIDKAAEYISARLKDAGVRPGGDDGSYFQNVGVQFVQSLNQSTLTVEVNGESRVFRNGEEVFFPANVGGKRTFVLTDVEFVGYGLHMGSTHNDYDGKDVKGKAVVWLGESAPVSLDGHLRRGSWSPAPRLHSRRWAPRVFSLARPSRGRFGSGGPVSFTTTQRLDSPRPPDISVSDDVLAFIFSASGLDYEELKAKARFGKVLTPAPIKGAKLTFNLDADYSVVNTRMTRNVVGFVDGSDPQLKNTYVAFGAHYDHLGIDEGFRLCTEIDRINNGADDDGSGSTALIGLANAFAAGPARADPCCLRGMREKSAGSGDPSILPTIRRFLLTASSRNSIST